jgi:photosystem II stability/assembly factor-like uncharacterized protein
MRPRLGDVFISALSLCFAACDSEAPVAAGDPGARVQGRPPIPRPDHPREAAEWRALTLRDEHGRVPHNALLHAKAQMDALRTEGIAGGLDSNNWTEIGPGNIGGRIRSIGTHPSTLNLFVGGVAGGLWQSTDAGASWSAVNDLMQNLAITSIVYTNPNPSTMYAATGEGFANQDAIRGAGIFKSSNGGATWAQLPATNNPDFYWVNRLAISNNAQILLAATGTGMFRSADGGASFQKVHGTANAACFDVRWHGFDNTLAVASLREWDNALMTWYSTSIFTTNGGLSWVESAGLRSNNYFDRVELHYMYFYNRGATPGCVYALKNVVQAPPAAPLTRLYRSTNGGATFALVNSTTGALGTQGWYDNCLWVDPTDDNLNVGDDRIVIGGIDLWRSTDGGASFTKISDWTLWPASPHADQHAIVEHPRYDGRTNFAVYVANDGGIWRTDNIYTATTNSGWVNLNNRLAITQFYGGSRFAGNDTVIGGTQDNGTLRFRGNANAWTQTFGGDGGFCASDPTDGSYHYGEYSWLRIYRSTDGAGSASYIWNGIADAGDKSPNPQTANFIAPFALDPNNASTMLAGGLSLWRSTNVKAATPAWAAIKAPVGSPISAIAIAPGNSNVIWVGHNDGAVWYTTNGTVAAPAWTRRDNTAPALPDRYVTHVTIDPKNVNRVFVTLGGFAADNIWQTTNAGANWAAAAGLPSAPMRDLEIHEANGAWLYAASDVGLLVSENNGAAWTSTATPANVAIDELFWSSHRLYLVTHGRGMFRQLAYASGSASNVGLACRYNGPITGPALTSGAPVLGLPLTWDASALPYPGNAVLFLSTVPAAPLQISPGCFVQLDLLILLEIGARPVSAAGTASWTLGLPDMPAWAGLSLMTQVAAVASGSLSLSNGRKLNLGY